MFQTSYTTDEVNFSVTLVRPGIFDNLSDPLKVEPGAVQNVFSRSTSPRVVVSGEMGGNMSINQGYLQSGNFQSGVNGWRFTAVGNLEANSGTFRGSIFATTGNIGQWTIDTRGIYYNGSGNPNIRTGATVGAGSNGVIIDKDGVRGYDATLGVVFNLHSNGDAPEFAFGSISESIFEVSTQAVIRTSETVGDGSSSSAGILINNTGLYGCGASQLLANANVKILTNGDAFFRGTINASTINASTINGATINSAIITGGTIQTAESGKRIHMDSDGITLFSGDTGAAYGDVAFKYGDAARPYGTGVLAYVNNSEVEVPIYFNAEQEVADIHLYPRSGNPVGPAQEGDLVSVGRTLRYCRKGGTPGDWMILTGYTTSSSSSSVSTSSSSSSSSSS